MTIAGSVRLNRFLPLAFLGFFFHLAEVITLAKNMAKYLAILITFSEKVYFYNI